MSDIFYFAPPLAVLSWNVTHYRHRIVGELSASRCREKGYEAYKGIVHVLRDSNQS